jgi:hypothetical protein
MPICRRSEASWYSRTSSRRLAGAGRPDDRDFHPGVDREVDLLQNRDLRAIMKADIVPGDGAARARRRKLPRAALEIGLGFQHLEDACGADPRARDQAPALGNLVDRRIELGEV